MVRGRPSCSRLPPDSLSQVDPEFPFDGDNLGARSSSVDPLPRPDLVTGGVVVPDQAVHVAPTIELVQELPPSRIRGQGASFILRISGADTMAQGHARDQRRPNRACA